MPKVAIADAPIQLGQTGMNGAVIQNVGDSTVYADDDSSISALSYGFAIAPRATLNWGTGRDLWVVCGAGERSELSLMFGSTGASLSEVSAVVTGDVNAVVTGTVDVDVQNASLAVTGNVTATIDNASIPVTGNVTATIDNASIPVTGNVNANITNATIDAAVTGNIVVDSGMIQVGGIDTPVRVQGGGEVLVDQAGNLTAGSSVTINIPAPASGLTYAGIGVILRNTSSAGNIAPLVATLYNNGFAIGSPTAFQAQIVTGDIDSMGTTEVCQLVAPVGADFPLRLDLNNGGSGTKGYEVIVVGLAYADTMIRDFGQWEGSEGEISFDNVAANSFAAIGASFETRQYALVSATGTVGAFDSGILLSTGAWETGQIRLQRTANVTADQTYIVNIPGDGRIHRIRAINAVTGLVRLSYLGRVS